MSAATLPRVAALYCGDGHAWYPARPTIPTMPDQCDVLWFASPVLPAGCPMRWADETDPIGTPHLVLDVTTVAELLYASQLDPGAALDDTELADVVLAQVDRWHCDLSGPIAVLAQDAGDHPEACARRMSWCVCEAARLLGTVVSL